MPTDTHARFAANRVAAIMAALAQPESKGSSVSQSLLAALQNPALFPHPVRDFQIIETHISWVLLTGDYAYKLKKPVNFGFLDFTDLAARKHYCEEELRLNQRLTEGLYLEVLPITGSETSPQVEGTGQPIEYMLKMRQFPQSQLLNNLQANGELTHNHIDELASQIAQFHLAAPLVPDINPHGSPEAVMAPVRQNFEQIRPYLTDKADLVQLDALSAWAESTFLRVHTLLEQRKTQGFIRECHGDIHLGNATILDGKVVIFDCIEFNEAFRFTDVYADTAFLAMDLEDRGLKSLARRFINQYLEITGDYAGLELLNFYKAYRALVRAKIALFSLNDQASAVERANTLRRYRNYANLAESYSAIPSRFLTITHGVSAVGKSHVAMRLVDALGAIRLRSDVERKRLLGTPSQTHGEQLAEGIYSAEANKATYTKLHALAGLILRAGFPVVIDATYLQGAQRDEAAQVAEATGVPFLILDCVAPATVIASWLAQRQLQGNDPSDATEEVIQAQQASRQPLTAAEILRSKVVETNVSASLDSLVANLRQRLPGL